MDSNVIPPEQLRAVMRLALKDIGNGVQKLEEPIIDENNPVIRELIKHVRFSRRLILTYYLVIATFILIWACSKWAVKLTGKNKRWESNENVSSVSSSSSSTLCGSGSPTKDTAVDETSHLLQRDGTKSNNHDSILSRFYCHLRAIMVTQPKPIPALTASANVLPANETTFLILIVLATNVFYLFFKTPLSWSMLFAFADRAALVFVANLPVLYVLAAKNSQPLQWLTGWSYEGLNIFHRRLGEWMTIAALLHGIGMIGVWWTLLRPVGLSLGWYLTRRIVLIGVIALIVYQLIFATSIGYVRERFYEMFLALHVVLQIAALVLVFFHHPNARLYVGAALAIWTIDRVIWRMSASMRSFVADLQIAPDGETVLLFCDISLGKSKFWTMRGGWIAGQHVFVSVPGIGWSHGLQSHPFTIASPAPPQGLKEGTWPLQLVIRAKDGFSKELLHYAKFHQHTRISLDGPHGNTEALETMQASHRVCLVAGGSGVAVTYPLAWSLLVGSDYNHDILASNRTRYVDGKKTTPLIKTLASAIDAEKFNHIWIRQQASHERWLTLFPKRTLHHDPQFSPAVNSGEHEITDLITDRFNTRNSSTSPSMRPDVGLSLTEWVRGAGDGTATIDRNQRICVVVSGPDTLVRSIRNTSASLIREGWNIEVVVEKFGW